MIELEFSERDGATNVLMINSGIPTDQRRRDQQGGWHRCYDNLDRIWV
jgi:activator of Hsp90 ATPase-like protein